MINAFKPPFIQVDIQITGRCNAKCIFCGCWRDQCRQDSDLAGSVWLETVAKIKDFAPVEFLCIGGGEPLLYRDIFQVIEGLNKLNIHTVVVSNGSLFSLENCKRILDTGISHIDFSIDNFSKEHNRMRGIPNLFEKCIEAISTLKKLNLKVSIGVSTLICAENIYDIPKFLEWVLKELPVDAINFQAYNRVVAYEGKDWWREDPLWPRNKGAIIDVMSYLERRTREGARIANDPLQFEKFKNYFIDPYHDLKIKCPAGTFNLSFSYRGEIVGCIADGNTGNILTDDPVVTYKEKFPAIRQKASSCKENCHFLINCYFPLHWKRWNRLVRDMVDSKEDEIHPGPAKATLSAEMIKTESYNPVKDDKLFSKPGKVIFPPEIREIASSDLINDYPDLIRYEEHKDLDVIGKYDDLENRRSPFSNCDNLPCIFLCGDKSEVHRWTVDLEENDFFKQVNKLEELAKNKAIYHIIVGVTRTNFHRLDKIYNLIKRTRKENWTDVVPFFLRPLETIKERFLIYLNSLGEKLKKNGIEFIVVDPQLEKLLESIQTNAHKDDFNERNFLMALGPVCKDVFVGPRYILFDLAGRCNLNCVYCRRFSSWNKDYWLNRHPELSGFIGFEVIENVLYEAKEIDVETVLLVGGGEPTLHPDFLRIINLIKDLGMDFNFSTNGALLNLYNRSLLDGCCKSITISLSFVSKESFSLIRPEAKADLRGKIESSVQELANLKKANNSLTPKIIALYAICKYNCHEIVQMAKHAKRLGADAIWYQLVHLEEFSKDQLRMDTQDMARARLLLSQAKKLCKKLNLEFCSFIDFEIKHYDEEKSDWSKEGLLSQGCFVGWHFAFIHLRREVFMCCGAKTVGILDKQGKGFKELWFSDAYRRYRNDGLIMHMENPLTLYNQPLYNKYCDSCDNHDQNVMMINLIKKYGLENFIQR